MKKEIVGHCPICHGPINITEIKCNSCDTIVRGSFKLCKFSQLTKEHKEFAEIFIKNRGNIKEIERELGISYPTVKGKLDALIEALGYSNSAPQTTILINRKEILERLDKGEIRAEEAIELLKE